MPYTTTVEGRVVHVAWAGVVSKEDLQSVGREMPRIAAQLGFAPDVLHTFDGVTGHTFQPIAVYMHALLRKQVEIPVPVKSAAVAKTPEVRGIIRVFKAVNRNPNLKMEIFDSDRAARDWLTKK